MWHRTHYEAVAVFSVLRMIHRSNIIWYSGPIIFLSIYGQSEDKLYRYFTSIWEMFNNVCGFIKLANCV